MKILQINKFFYLRGGSSRYFFEVSALLKFHGREVAYFSMEDPHNQESEWSKYFVSNISFEKVALRRLLGILARMFYSVEARNNISNLLDHFRPDVVHIHSIYHHISPSIILELKKRNIPMVQTLHDYHLISPSHTLFHNGRICEITKKNNFYKAIFHKCIKNSYLASFAEVSEKYFHYLLGWERSYIDYFTAPSLFMRNKLIEYGVPVNKVRLLHNFCNDEKFQPHYESGDYFLYFGRFSPEKGLDFLIDVMGKIPQIQLKVVGQGLIKDELRQRVNRQKRKNVNFLGYKTGDQLRELIYNCKFTILPSLCYEVFPISILETYASGKPVIASNIGGIPETVKDGYNGFLFEPGNIDDCAEKINKLWNNPALCKRLGKNARNFVEKHFGPEEHYEKLMEIYKRAIERHR